MDSGNVSLAVAFSAGLLSFLSPCVLPLVPVYLASLYGPEIFDPALRNRVPIFLHSLTFVLGFSAVFVMLGVGAGLGGLVLSPYSGLVRRVSGSLLIVFGGLLLAALKVPWLNFEKRLAPSGRLATGYARSFLTGAVFSLAWTPCVSPILGGILALAWSSQTVVQGGYLLGVYSLGLGLPFLVLGAAFDSVHPLLSKISRYSSIFYIISGVLLVAVGILVLTNRLNWLQAL